MIYVHYVIENGSIKGICFPEELETTASVSIVSI